MRSAALAATLVLLLAEFANAQLAPTLNGPIVEKQNRIRFKIPETPIYVGFTSNIGPGEDDMRFFFGTRFDFSKLVSKLLPANP
jgi:hypothetical protein